MFLVSGPELVIAQCTAGIVGAFPALNARPQAALAEWLERITAALAAWDSAHPQRPAAPFAVNLIVHATNPRLDEDLETCLAWRVPILVTSLGARPALNDRARAAGALVLHDVIDDGFARKAIDKGAHGLIAVATGAGGHAGTLSPFALLQDVRRWFDGPLLLAGAIASGDAVLAAEAAGADLAYVGSAFIATEEARAAPAYRQMIVDGAAADVVYTAAFSGVAANYLRASVRAHGLDPDTRPTRSMDFGAGLTEGDGAKPWRDVWSAGQGIGVVDRVVTTATLVDRLRREYVAARRRLALSGEGGHG